MSENPSATLFGIVEKVFISRLPGEPKRAQIGVEGRIRKSVSRTH